LRLSDGDWKIVEPRDSDSLGEALLIAVESERLTVVSTAFGSKRVPAELLQATQCGDRSGTSLPTRPSTSI
jgi:hypothetical protein